VKDLSAFLISMGLDQIDLLGHSMGGFVAQRFVLAHPQGVRSLSLLCTGPEVPALLPRTGFEKAAEIAEAQGIEGLQVILEKVGRIDASPSISGWGERYWIHHRRRFRAMSAQSYAGVGSAFFASESLVPRLREISQSTLVMVGEFDTDWLPGARLFSQNLSSAKVVFLSNAEHHPHQENTLEFLHTLEAHLGKASRSRQPALTQGPSNTYPPSITTKKRENTMSRSTEEVQITTSGGETMGAYLALPEGGGPAPAVIVWMEIFGVNEHIQDVARRFAAEGYVALAPDFFHRTGPGIQLDYNDEGFAEGFKHLGALKADQMIADARDTVAYLRGRDEVIGDKIGATGFCIGGHMTYLTACETDVAAAASYYGGGIAAPEGPGGGEPTLARTSKISGRIVCYFGGQDTLIPSDEVEAVKSALAKAGTDHEVHIYEDADHGFNCDRRGTYHEASANDSWEKTKTLFEATLRS
jgi:carboxymethylenebutenolidase